MENVEQVPHLTDIFLSFSGQVMPTQLDKLAIPPFPGAGSGIFNPFL
jgi:hypothetical protein